MRVPPAVVTTLESPVLAVESPEYKLARPAAPGVKVRVPLSTIFPPALVPAAAVLPALTMIADVPVFDALTFCEMVMSPVPVSTSTVPAVAAMPLVAPTAPMASVSLS